MLTALRRSLVTWIFRPRGREAGPVLLVHRRVFIVPSRQGLLFGLLLALMLLGSMNYSLSLGYVLTFLLGTMGMVSILHTFRNLVHLRVRAGKVAAVFAGDIASFPVCLESPDAHPRYSIGVARRGEAPAYGDVPGDQPGEVSVRLAAPRRGWLRPGEFRVFTRFPLGLFYAWSNVELDMRCLVYPRPDTSRLPLPMTEPKSGTGAEFGTGDEDFLGMRPYRPGDSPRHVAWKAVAQGRGLLTKQFSGRAESELWLDWDLLAGMATEARLARLTRWVLEAHAAGLSYGLRIPGVNLAPAHAEVHRERCLRALALHDIREAA
jgi:uncharacterized protein (DUF58 family)